MPSTYRTISGDTWDMIAYKTLGDGKWMHLLIAENPTYCETFIFPAGIALHVPEKPEITSKINPPWFTTE